MTHRADTMPTMQTEQLPPPKGLFAHIQSNNLKSLVLFAWFAIILQMLQITVMVFFVSLGSPMHRSYSGEATDVPDHAVLAHKCGPNTSRTLEYCNRKIAKQNLFEYIVYNFDKRTQFFHGQSLLIFIPALLYIILGFWFQSAITRRQTNAIRVSRQEQPRLHGLIEPLAIARGLPTPQIEIIESAAMNAYASGFTPRNSAIGVTRGLIDNLNDSELEAVLAHEFAHIENRDNRLMTMANLCAGAITPIGNQFRTGFSERPVVVVACIVLTFAVLPFQVAVFFHSMLALTWLMAEGAKHAISRKREFIADARAIEIVKEPAALMSALQKIARNDQIEGLNPTVQAMMISNLSGQTSPTHPSISERIAAISATTNVTLADALSASQRQRRQYWAGQETTSPSHTEHPGRVRLSDRAQVRRHGKNSEGAVVFGQRASSAASSCGNTRADKKHTATPQWTAEEIRSDQILETAHVVEKHARTGMKAVFVLATAPLWLPVLIVPLMLIGVPIFVAIMLP